METKPSSDKKTSPKKKRVFDAIKIETKGFVFDRDEANER
jgi:hypothetical protein